MKLVLTQPQAQARRLAQQFEAYGIRVECLPLVTIEPLASAVAQVKSSIREINTVICTSPTVVDLLPSDLVITKRPRWFAIGRTSARKLMEKYRQHNLRVDYPEPKQNSEALIAMLPLESMKNKNTLLLTGVGGRNFIDTHLREHNISVMRIELYTRHSVAYSHATIHAHCNKDSVWLMTSAENLTRLYKMNPKQPPKIIVTSERLMKKARQYRYNHSLSRSNRPEDIMQLLL